MKASESKTRRCGNLTRDHRNAAKASRKASPTHIVPGYDYAARFPGRTVHVHDPGGTAGPWVFLHDGRGVVVAVPSEVGAGALRLFDEFPTRGRLEPAELAERAAEWLTRERQWFEVGEIIDR